MKCTIVFVSPNGTTKASARLLKEEFEADGQNVQMFDIGRGDLRHNLTPVQQALQRCDLALFGAPVYHMDMLSPMQHLFRQMEQDPAPFSCVGLLFLNYAGITSGKALLNSARSLQRAGVQVAGALKISAPHFHHQARFPTGETRALVKDFYLKLKEIQFRPLSAPRTKALFKPEKRRVSALYPLVHLVGKKRELPITIDQDKCRLCSKCALECPVEAITVSEKGASIDPDSCIHCYHCTIACPFGAIHSPVEKLDSMIAKNKRIIGTEQPPNKINI